MRSDIGRAQSVRDDSEHPPRLPDDARLTTWLKGALLALVIWTLLEKFAATFSYVRFAALIGIGGLLLAYLLYPLVRLVGRRLPLWAAIAIVYVGFVALLGLAARLLLPIVAGDVLLLLQRLPDFAARSTHLVEDVRLPFMRAATTTQSHAMIPSIVGSLDAHIREQLAAFVNALSGEAISLVSLSALIIAVPATSIYMLLEAHAARRFFLAMLPHAHRRRADAIIMQVDAVLGGFIRGQVLVAIVVAIMVTAMLLLLRVPYAVLIGVWAGVLDVVPYLGAAAGAIPGVAIAFLSNGVLDAVLVSFGFAAIFELEGNLIAPKIVSRTVGISPLTVVFAVIVGGEIFGPTGMLIAVPVAGVIRVVIENVRPAPLP